MKFSGTSLRFYLVTDRSWLKPGETLAQQVEQALLGGATMVQLREKTLSREMILEEARELLVLCHRFGVPLILNDDPQLALEAGADGVHIGQEDMAYAQARKLLGPDKIIGVSAHNPREALAAQEAGADYLGCGAVFGSSTKDGVQTLTPEGLREICTEKDILLIFDEIQCGMGRTGTYFAWQSYGVKPDIMTCAKALGSGVPVGAFVLGEKAAEASLAPGDHGTTYGGNPFVCAAVSKVFDIFEEDHILEHVRELTPYLEEKLDGLVEKYDTIAARRGKGFMQGLVITGIPVGTVVSRALEKGLLVISAGSDVLRLVPPLVITKEHIDLMIEILEKSLA